MLVHGLSSSSEGWWRLGPDLAASGWSVTAPDLRGHGASGDGDDFSLSGYVADVLALGSGWDLVLGHSLGGLVALACQRRDPSFAKRLVLEDPWLDINAGDEVLEWLGEEYNGPITAERIATTRPRWHPEDVSCKVRALEAAGEDVMRATCLALDGVDLRTDLLALRVPTLLMGADPELDALMSPEEGKAAEANPEVTYVMVAGSSHSIHRDSYEAFWMALAAFAGVTLPD